MVRKLASFSVLGGCHSNRSPGLIQLLLPHAYGAKVYSGNLLLLGKKEASHIVVGIRGQKSRGKFQLRKCEFLGCSRNCCNPAIFSIAEMIHGPIAQAE